jgi:hypothetical protein
MPELFLLVFFVFWWYGGLNSGLPFARQTLYPLELCLQCRISELLLQDFDLNCRIIRKSFFEERLLVLGLEGPEVKAKGVIQRMCSKRGENMCKGRRKPEHLGNCKCQCDLGLLNTRTQRTHVQMSFIFRC